MWLILLIAAAWELSPTCARDRGKIRFDMHAFTKLMCMHRAPNIPTHNPYPRLPRRHTDGHTRSLTHSHTCPPAADSTNLALRAPTVAGGHVGSRIDADRRGLVVHGQGSSTHTRARTAQVRNFDVLVAMQSNVSISRPQTTSLGPKNTSASFMLCSAAHESSPRDQERVE